MAAELDLDAELAKGREAAPRLAADAVAPKRELAAPDPKDTTRPEWRKQIGKIRRAARMMDSGQEHEAARLALKILDAAPDMPLANQTMAMALERLGRLSKALDFYERAWKLDPDNPDLYRNISIIAWKLDMLPVAEKFVRLAAQLAPDDPANNSNLACILRDQGRFDDAIELIRQAIYRDQENATLWNTLGTILMEAGDPEQAIQFYEESIRLDPDMARTKHNLAYALELAGDADRAVELFTQARDAATDKIEEVTIRHGRSLSLLAAGRLAEGWDEYDVRLLPEYSSATLFAVEAPMWDGADPAEIRGKTLLVMGEQGLGDEVMFMNALADVIDTVGPEGEVRVACAGRLLELVRRSFPGVVADAHQTLNREGRNIRAASTLTADGAVEMWTPMAQPCRAFRRSVADFPDAPFMTADADKVAAWREQLAGFGPGLKVGLLWKSLKMDAKRTKFFTAFETWKPVLETPGVEFVNLQYGEVDEEIALAEKEFGVTIHQPQGIDLKDDLDDVAALGKACDLVIGPMNATTNLAASVGGEVWLIFSQRRYWAMLGAENPPWYATARAFGGLGGYGDWRSGMREIAEALAERVESMAAA
ncbi:tetratricopeptide repeat protein [Marinicauda salina]|nr:tetratricopeptide repeat protein [Marinicauda salina]